MKAVANEKKPFPSGAPDPLGEYRRKRNFDVTSEPAPQPVTESSGHHFMIHKHHATRLHYDLRLEIGGVLASWAVPKGLSYDPSDKRLAVQTEDHPLEYGGFEGRIPDGEYGAGDSLIWDEGTWDTVPSGQAAQQLEKGHLKFKLEGEKLVGEWHLVRTRFEGKKQQWLCFKAKDGTEKPGYDVEKERPESIKSGRKSTRGPVFKKVLSGAHPDPAALLKKVWPPMLAVLSDEGATGPGWIYEVKYDGFRALAAVSGGKVAMQSRNALDFVTRFPWAAEALGELTVGEAVIDGELVSFDAKGVSRFGSLGADGFDHRFVAFDLLWLEGEDLRGRPLEDRRELLESLLAHAPDTIMLAERVEGDEKQVLAASKKNGWEGVIAKQAGSTYEGRRSTLWRKLKTTQTAELAIIGFTPITNGKKQIGALLLGTYEQGKLRYAGKVGTGFDAKQRRELFEQLNATASEKSPFGREIREKGALWVEPTLVAQVKFGEWTPDGRLRHPAFQGLRIDKAVTDAVQEVPAPKLVPEPVAAAPSKSALDVPPPDQIATTHPAKVMFPKSGYTKADVRAYFDAVAPALVRAMEGRALSMQQWPQGIAGQSFFRHDATTAPKWITRADVAHDNRTVHHLVIDSPSTVAWLANNNALTLHMMSARAATIQQPEWVVFDLDPANDDQFATVIEMANTLHGMLEQLKLRAYPKTSGKRGMHVLVPIDRGPTHAQVTEFAAAVLDTIAAKFSTLVTTERMKAKRHGRLYLDAFQNGYLKTIVAPYSIRAVEGAPVSAPLEWSEVKEGLSPADFTIKTMPARLKKKGDLFEPVLEGGQKLPSLGS